MEITDKSAEIKYEKFTDEEWSQIDKPLNELELKVSNVLRKLGSANSLDELDEMVNEFPYQICGEALYIEKIRPTLVSKKVVSKKGASKVVDQPKKEKKASKGKKFQENKTKELEKKIVEDRIEKELTSIIANFESERKEYTVGFFSNSKILELRLLSLIYYSTYYVEAFEEFESEAYEVIVGTLKILNVIEKLSGPSVANNSKIVMVSKTLFEDLRTGLTGIAKKYKFSIQHMFQHYPRLIISTNFDSFFAGLDISPYPSQIQLLDKLKLEFENNKGALILYRAMIGSGKTSSSIALAAFAKQMQEKKPDCSLTILYVCSLKNVRHQVAKLAQGNGVGIAVATLWDLELEIEGFTKGGQKMDEVLEAKIRQRRHMNADAFEWQAQLKEVEGINLMPRQINHFSCKNNKNPEMIVTDLLTAYYILKHKRVIWRADKYEGYSILNKNEIVLFLDEPTVNANIVQSTVNMLEFYPKFTIFSSATLPANEKMQSFLQLYHHFHPKNKVHTVHSVDSNVGIQLMSFKYVKKVPHIECKTSQEVAKISNKIQINGFLARLYNGVNVFELYNQMKDCGMKIDDMEEYFLEPSHLSQTHIQKKASELLKALSRSQEDTIAKVCDKKNFEQKLTEVEKEELNISGKKKLTLDPSSLMTSQANKFMGGCLIAVKEPFAFAEQHFKSYTEDLKSLSNYLKRFEKDQAKFDKEIQVLFDTIKNEENLFQQIDQKQNNRPTIKFPEEKRINSLAHLRLHFKKNLEKHHFVHIQKEVFFDDVPMNSTAMDWLVQLLICGVGIYQTNHPNLDKPYLDAVMDLASQRKLSFLISNAELSYGTNIPINHVIIFDDLGTQLGLGSIFQLMGRAGRVGQSWSAYAHIQDQTLNKIENFIKSDHVFVEESEERDIENSVNNYIDRNKDLNLSVKKFSTEESKILTHYGVVFNFPSIYQFYGSLCVCLHIVKMLEKEKEDKITEKDFGEFISAFCITFKKSFSNGYYAPTGKLKEMFWLAEVSKDNLKSALNFTEKIHVFCKTEAEVKIAEKLKSSKIKIYKIIEKAESSFASQLASELETQGGPLDWKFPEEIANKRENLKFSNQNFLKLLTYLNPQIPVFADKTSEQMFVMLQFYYDKLKSDYEHIGLSRFYPFFAFNEGMINPKLVEKILEDVNGALEPLEYFCINEEVRDTFSKLTKEKFQKSLKMKEAKECISLGKRIINPWKVSIFAIHLLRGVLAQCAKMGICQNAILIEPHNNLKARGLLKLTAFSMEGGIFLDSLAKECKEVFVHSTNYLEAAVNIDKIAMWEVSL